MVSFIIYDEDAKRRSVYSEVVNRFLFSSSDYFKIYDFDEYNVKTIHALREIEGSRIYLLNIDSERPNGLDLARKIRNSGDFISPIILITAKKRRYIKDRLNNILYLDILEHDEDIVKNLLFSLTDAYKIATRNSVYTFAIFDEVYRVPYNDIYYIKKNNKDDSVTIYTKDDTYIHYITIKALEQELIQDPRFFKVHRSCIVNLYNVSSYDRKNNVIVFKDGTSIDLISRQKKSVLSNRLKEYSNTI